MPKQPVSWKCYKFVDTYKCRRTLKINKKILEIAKGEQKKNKNVNEIDGKTG